MSGHPRADLDACEREAIYAPGSIQPHGVLLALEPGGLTVTHASVNCLLAHREAVGLLGRPVSALLSPDAEDALRQGRHRTTLRSRGPSPWPCLGTPEAAG